MHFHGIRYVRLSSLSFHCWSFRSPKAAGVGSSEIKSDPPPAFNFNPRFCPCTILIFWNIGWILLGDCMLVDFRRIKRVKRGDRGTKRKFRIDQEPTHARDQTSCPPLKRVNLQSDQWIKTKIKIKFNSFLEVDLFNSERREDNLKPFKFLQQKWQIVLQTSEMPTATVGHIG